jgi:hypothetical protein
MGRPVTEFDIERCTRHCALTGREFAEGEEFFSVLVREGKDLRRRDYALDAWTGPPEGTLGWWKSRLPSRDVKKNRMATSELLLELFGQWTGDDQRDLRYVLALLMIRRRILRLEETIEDQRGEVLVLYSPREETTYEVPVVMPDDARASEIQEQLSRLLFSDAS